MSYQYLELLFILLLTFVQAELQSVNGHTDNLQIGSIRCHYEASMLYNGHCIKCLNDNAILHQNNSSSNRNIQINSTIICPTSLQEFQRMQIQKAEAVLRERPLRAVTSQRPPFSKVTGNEYSGVMFDILNAMMEKYHFNVTISLPTDGQFGSRCNGNWSGMVGQVMRREYDIGAAAFSITEDRSKVVDFTFPVHQDPTAILIPAPTPGDPLMILIRPFEPEVWAGLFLTVFLLAPTFYFLHKMSLKISSRSKKKGNGLSLEKSIAEMFMFITGSLVQEGLIAPVNKTTRFLVAIWWMLTLVLANAYVGFLVSFLSAPKLYNSVNTLNELVHQSNLKWTFRKGTAHQSLFKSEESIGVYKLIGDAVQEPDLVLSDADGVVKTLKHRTAFIKERSYLDIALGCDFNEVHHCRLTLAKEEFFTAGVAFIVQKKSPLLPLFNKEISVAVATGLMSKWKSINWPHNLFCVDAASYIISTQPKSRKLNLTDFHGVSVLWIVGIVFASIGFGLEHLYHEISLKRRSKTSPTPTTSASTTNEDDVEKNIEEERSDSLSISLSWTDSNKESQQIK